MTTTLPDEPPLERVRRAGWVRRAGATLLAAFVLAGAVGVFGTRTATASGGGEGYAVDVTYPQVSRPGHAVRFRVHLHHAGGFPDPIHLRMRSRYLDLFDENAFHPTADSQTTDATYEYFDYAAPHGDDFVLTVDTRVEPDRQRGESGAVSLLDGTGTAIVTVRFRTRIFP